MTKLSIALTNVLTYWWGTGTLWPSFWYQVLNIDGRLCMEWTLGNELPHRGSGKFIDQLTDMVVALDAGESQYRVAWHTLAGYLYREGINPTDGQPFTGVAPAIGLPPANPKRDTFVVQPPPPPGPEAGFGKVTPPGESFPNWSQGDLKAERAKRQRQFDSLWAEAREAWLQLQAVNTKIK